MAKEFDGQRSTNFFECRNADELLNHAKDGNCEETTITLDPVTNNGFIVAFNVRESDLEDLSGDKLVVMTIFFAELCEEETRYYRNMLHGHRNEQEQDMEHRKSKKKKLEGEPHE